MLNCESVVALKFTLLINLNLLKVNSADVQGRKVAVESSVALSKMDDRMIIFWSIRRDSEP